MAVTLWQLERHVSTRISLKRGWGAKKAITEYAHGTLAFVDSSGRVAPCRPRFVEMHVDSGSEDQAWAGSEPARDGGPLRGTDAPSQSPLLGFDHHLTGSVCEPIWFTVGLPSTERKLHEVRGPGLISSVYPQCLQPSLAHSVGLAKMFVWFFPVRCSGST